MSNTKQKDFVMKPIKILLISILVLFAVSSTAAAKDFGWTRAFNIQAKADLPQFRARMAARFDLSDMQVIALRNFFASPADAYIMLRLGEIQGGLKKISREQAIDAVNKYRCHRDKGWEELAGILGVETGSKEFLSLKLNHDLYDTNSQDQVAFSDFDSVNDNM